MLWQRVVTALLLLPLILGAIFLLPNVWFALAMVVPVLIAGREWAAMAGVCRNTFTGLLALSLAAVFGIEQLWVGAAMPLLYMAAAFWLWAFFLVVRYPALTRWFRQRALMYLIGLVLLVPAWYAVVQLQAIPFERAGTQVNGLVLLGAFLIVWGADVGAYFSGRAFGKRKLAPQVSPGKSIAGAVGGMLTTLATALGIGFYLGWSLAGILQLLALVFVATLASILGDLFESMVKREAGVKDSGTLLPGHGGMLDRIDSVTCALPVFALGLQFVHLT
ncbi:MAG: phosphatidate cytidylyltransferase [Pseudomonadota bacterium]